MQPLACLVHHGLALAWYVFLCYAVSNALAKMEKPRAGSHHINLFYGNLWKYLTFLNPFVFAFFWGIYFYDRELVYPTYVEPFIPKWMNYGMHTVILPLVLLEIFVTPQRYPSMGKSLVILGAAALCYQVWILYIYAKTEKWVYPVFEILSPLSKIVFGGIAAIILFFCYMIGRFLHLMIWGDTVVMLDVYKKKSK